MKLLQKDGDSRKNLMMLCLAAAGVMEFLFITLESRFGGLGYYVTETYLIVPALLFLGCALGGQLTKFAGKRLALAGAAICWFVLVQIIHKLFGMDTHPIATVFAVYLLAFPFASASDDADNIGIHWIGGMFVTASMVLVGYSALLLADMVPAGWKECLYWDGTRLHAFWHSNISACFFMIGISFSAVFLVKSRTLFHKILMAVMLAAQFAAMALTNCRTTILLTGALLGGTVFFLIFKGGWKRFVLGLLAAVMVLVGTYKLSGEIYQWNDSRIVANISAVLEEDGLEELEGYQFYVDQDGQVVMNGNNQQDTLTNDMRTLNGRTDIWAAALNAVRDSKAIALFGTEYSGLAISVYNWFDVVHAHNSWMEALMRMGVPGLLMSLLFTVLSVWSAAKLVLNQSVELWKKIVAMLTMCVMAAGFLEPYLFITNVYYHVIDFAFFFLTGYLDRWANAPRKETV